MKAASTAPIRLTRTRLSLALAAALATTACAPIVQFLTGEPQQEQASEDAAAPVPQAETPAPAATAAVDQPVTASKTKVAPASAPATPPAAAMPTAPAPAAPPAAPAASPAPASAAAADPASALDGGKVAGQARTFSTRHATYVEAGFDRLPGWGSDDFVAGWPTFMSSCRSLAKRKGDVWRELCARAEQVDARDERAIRGFYEREFSVYQIRDDDSRSSGVVTGYFAPEISGSRKYNPPFIYPVYATPSDLLLLDTRRLPKGGTGDIVVRVEGQKVSVAEGHSIADTKSGNLYALAAEDASSITADKRARLRVDGRRVVPYYTRQEIEAKGAPNARVLAFVQDAHALYEMQIQGSGRIRLQDGSVLPVGYAEQNGQPFRPMVAKSSSGKTRGIRMRGGFVELELDDDFDDFGDVTEATLTRGFSLVKPASSGPVAVPGQTASAKGTSGTGNTDPSYVFFRQMDQNQVVGALGVPLTAERSIAVDPRSTPLGYPVFVSTREPVSGKPIQRLTLAQDTGGAIRGAIRADYFYGSGQDAANSARRMKQQGEMWVLLPRGQTVAVATTGSGPRTRGAGLELADCLVADDDICAED